MTGSSDSGNEMARGYSSDAPPSATLVAESANGLPPGAFEDPVDVRAAARFLGVSSQTVYLWVERRRIPHLRVMGRNIRFLKSDLQLFRAQFHQEVENATTE